MECIHCRHSPSPIFPSISQQQKHKRSKTTTTTTTDQLLWFSNSQLPSTSSTEGRLRSHNIPSLLPLRTNQPLSASSSLIFGLTSPPPAESGDISVLLLISAFLLPLYWVTNFVIPEMMIKDFQTKNTSEEQEEDDVKPMNKQ